MYPIHRDLHLFPLIGFSFNQDAVYFIHIKTQQGDSSFETDNIEDTLLSILNELITEKNHVLDIKVDRGTLEQHFIEMARREAE